MKASNVFSHQQTWERRKETREKPGDARRRERRKRREEPRETRGVTRVARRRGEPRADAMRREETRGDARDARRRERREEKREWLGLKFDFREFRPFDANFRPLWFSEIPPRAAKFHLFARTSTFQSCLLDVNCGRIPAYSAFSEWLHGSAKFCLF